MLAKSVFFCPIWLKYRLSTICCLGVVTKVSQVKIHKRDLT